MRPGLAKRVWASLEREPWEVVAEATLEAERHDPEHAKRWVVLVGAMEAGAAEPVVLAPFPGRLAAGPCHSALIA